MSQSPTPKDIIAALGTMKEYLQQQIETLAQFKEEAKKITGFEYSCGFAPGMKKIIALAPTQNAVDALEKAIAGSPKESILRHPSRIQLTPQ